LWLSTNDDPLQLRNLAIVVFDRAVIMMYRPRALALNQHVDDLKPALHISSAGANVKCVVVVGHALGNAHESRKIGVGGDNKSIRTAIGHGCVGGGAA